MAMWNFKNLPTCWKNISIWEVTVMKILNRKSKKAIVISAIAACRLFAGSMGAGAEGSTAASKTGQAQLYASSVKAAATLSKKGVMSFPKRFNKKNVINELKPEAVNLIKTYGSTLQTGSTRNFNAYVDKHGLIYCFRRHLDYERV